MSLTRPKMINLIFLEEMSSKDEEDLDDTPANQKYQYKWHPDTAGMHQFPFTRKNELKVSSGVDRTPYDRFLMMIDNVFLENICKHTPLTNKITPPPYKFSTALRTYVFQNIAV